MKVRELLIGGVAAGALALSGTASAQLNIVDNIAGNWIDISGTGTPLSLSDDGEVDFVTGVGNAVLAAGTTSIGSNGAVRFAGTNQSLSFSNAAIPASGLFGLEQALAPFWDDVNTSGGTNGQIYAQDVGGVYVVQWEGVDFFGGDLDTATFQLQVHSSGPALAQFLYMDIEDVRANGGESATIGYQAGGIQNDVQWSFNTAGSVSNGTVLSLVPAPSAAVLLGLGGLAATRRRR